MVYQENELAGMASSKIIVYCTRINASPEMAERIREKYPEDSEKIHRTLCEYLKDRK